MEGCDRRQCTAYTRCTNNVAPHSPLDPSPTRESANGHRPNLTIDTSITSSQPLPDIPRASQETTVAATSVPEDSTQVGADNANAPSGLTSSPNDRPNSSSTAAAETEDKKLDQVFAFDPSLSDDETHKSIHQVYQQSPTDRGHDMSSPAMPESMTTEMYVIGLGVMWEPWHSDANSRSNHTSLQSSGKRSAKSAKSVKCVRTPPSLVRLHSLISKRDAAPFRCPPSLGPPVLAQAQRRPPQQLRANGRRSPAGGRRRTARVSPGGARSCLRGPSRACLRRTATYDLAEGKGTIFELDEDVPTVPGTPEYGRGDSASASTTASALSEGGDGVTQGQITAQLVGQ